MIRIRLIDMWAMAVALLLAPAGTLAQPLPGHLPRAYVAEAGGYAWTGRLRAWAGSTLWEAGALLDAREPASRQLFTSLAPAEGTAERLVPLRWDTLDDATRQRLDHHPGTGQPDQRGARRLDWLRGEHGPGEMRRRDTRLGHVRGNRVRVVAPPVWQPGKPGHHRFRQQYAKRPTVAWIASGDALLHGFDAHTGHERAAYLPRLAMPGAAALAEPSGSPRLTSACPRPEATDVSVGGTWRTLLLCGVAGREVAGIFVLDASDPSAHPPLHLVWEAPATAALPLSARGPVRVAVLHEDNGLQPFAVTTTAATASGNGALALLRLDRAPAAWTGRFAPVLLPIPATGCGRRLDSASLLALTVRTDFAGRALAAYATDSSARLWRFDFGAPLAQLPDRPPRCLRASGRPARQEAAEAPLLYGASDGVLVVQAIGNRVEAVPDRATGAPGKPRRIQARENGTGVTLAGVGPADPDAGWQFTLPHAGETVEELAATGPGYLHVVSRALDGQRRVYLMLASTGESVAATGPGGALAPFLTGQGIGRDDTVVAQVTWHDSAGPQAGRTTRDTGAIALSVVGATSSTTLADLPISRRRGRMSWRELVPTGGRQP